MPKYLIERDLPGAGKLGEEELQAISAKSNAVLRAMGGDVVWQQTFALFNSLVSPWHQWLDPEVYRRHADDVQALAPRVVASAHGPVLTGPAIDDAFDRVRAMAGAPIVAPPGQPALDEILASLVAVAEPVG